MRLIFTFVAISLFVTSCSWMPFVDQKSAKEAEEERQETLRGLGEKEIYDRIQRFLAGKNWNDAIATLQSFEAQFPFGNYAEQAQLELIYAYAESSQFEQATASADRFIRLHPRHPNVDYAYYVKGLSDLSMNKGLFSNFIPVDESLRDPGEARKAFVTFNELISRYPNSAYAADARKRMLSLRVMLARHEIHAANYYFKRGAYLAAANRGRYVVENFQQTPAVPDGLAVMAEAYYLMDLRELARDAEQVLAANYPDHPSLDEQGQFNYQAGSINDEENWVSRLSFGYYKAEKPPHYDSRDVYHPVNLALSELQGNPPPDSVTSTPAQKRSWFSKLTLGLFD